MRSRSKNIKLLFPRLIPSIMMVILALLLNSSIGNRTDIRKNAAGELLIGQNQTVFFSAMQLKTIDVTRISIKNNFKILNVNIIPYIDSIISQIRLSLSNNIQQVFERIRFHKPRIYLPSESADDIPILS